MSGTYVQEYRSNTGKTGYQLLHSRNVILMSQVITWKVSGVNIAGAKQ